MKKVLFTILGFSVFALSAQVQEKAKIQNPPHEELKIVVKNDHTSSNAKRDLGTGWFDYATAYNDFNGAGLAANIWWIQPDTTLYTVYSNGTKRSTAFHVIGRVCDPRDEVYSNNPIRFSKHNEYTWDSIRYTQFYIRNADSMKVGNAMVEIVDTVFIQYFKPDGLFNQTYWFVSDPSTKFYFSVPKRTAPDYNKKTRLNKAAFKTDTIFLTKAWADSIDLDAGTVFGRGVSAPVGTTITPVGSNVNSSIIGHSIMFKPMKKNNLGDTGIAFDGSTVHNKYNIFGLRLFSASGVSRTYSDQQAQNNSFIINYQVSEGQTVGTIYTTYLAGNAFANEYFDPTQYHLTSQTVDIHNVDAQGNGIGNIYPNPSNGVNEVMVPVRLAVAQTVTLTISDITGKVIKTITATYEAGDFDIAVSTEGMSNGVYTCTMSSGSYTSASKFILN